MVLSGKGQGKGRESEAWQKALEGPCQGLTSWAGYSTSLNRAFHVCEGRLGPLSVPQHREPG